MPYLYLALAVLIEVGATLSLKMAGHGSKPWYLLVITGYTGAFVLLSLTLAGGVPLGVAYGIWVAAGVALTAALSAVLFGEPLNRTMLTGIGLIAVGVLLVELGANH